MIYDLQVAAMKKIILLIALALPALAPPGVGAEMVGALMPAKNVPYFMDVHAALVKELEALGTGAEVVLQKPAPSEMAWKNATRKLVMLGAKVIVAYGSETALAIIAENAKVPVVYTAAYDPTECGVTGKVTGMEATIPLEGLIENLKKIANFSKLAIMYSSDEIGSVKQMEAAAALALKTGSDVIKIDTNDPGAAKLADADAVLFTSAASVNDKANLEGFLESTRARKIATASVLCATCQNGVLISLSANAEQQGKGAAEMVAEILKGKNPGDIPPNKNPQIETTVNLKEAKDLGFSIPFELLGTAKVVK
jgi:putative ABC transport system substrate-binding protein